MYTNKLKLNLCKAEIMLISNKCLCKKFVQKVSVDVINTLIVYIDLTYFQHHVYTVNNSAVISA